ncbi:MAG: metalloregulator ArsR/SmtB family transcription factor [Cellvibrionaceae bacterium]
MEPLQLFKCLSDQTRLNCTFLIYKAGEICVCDLVDILGESQPKISRHLAQLRRCGLLIDTKREQWVYYSINPKLPKWAKKILEETLQINTSHFLKLGKKIKILTKNINCC